MPPLLARYFDDLAVGDAQTSRGRTITETDVVTWCALTGDWFLLHSNVEYARESRFGARVAPGIMVYAYAAGLGVPPDAPGVIANYGADRLRYVGPVFIGDTIHVEMAVTALEARGDGATGVTTLRWDVLTQTGAAVIRSDLKVLMARAPETTRRL